MNNINNTPIDIEDKLQKNLSEELSRAIDKQIMNDLKPYIREAKINSILKEIDKRKPKSSE